MGIGTIMILPFLHCLWMGYLVGPKILKLVDNVDMEKASPLIIVSVWFLMARYGTLIGPTLATILGSSLALIAQEIGQLGAVFIALPVAMMLGLRREAIGCTNSVGRETNLGLIGDLYGMDSPEGLGAIGAYVTGTVFGTILFSILGNVFGTFTNFHPISLAMAAGTGSASMMTAASSTLSTFYPDLKSEILAFAAASNLLTGATGLYKQWLLQIPMTEAMYKKLVLLLDRNNKSQEARSE
ncbi:MAG TPA: DUF3100 domain-containing protein [Firmicutes bacterium]|nr:DUF3100 domain-containing protein [Bacillota bacterium]